MSEAFPTQAQVVVIGAGVTGCSAAYHLTRLGVKDVVVIERNQLGCGTTWHSAGNITLLESLPAAMALYRRTRDTIPELEKEAGQSIGWRNCGRVVLARSEARLDDLRRIRSLGRVIGVDIEIIDPAEVKRKFPLMRPDDLVGAAWSPGDGRVNPTDITSAYMRVARQRGARLVEETKVTGFAIESGRVTGVETDKGRIACESVVLAAGLWSRRIGAMAGVGVPLHAVEHFYVLTKPIEGVTPDLPVFRDPDALRENTQTSRSNGFRGRFAIHPAQLDIINEVFSPSADEIQHARDVIAAFDEAAAQGRGSTSLDGKVVDVPVVKRAQALLDLAETMEASAE